MPRKPSFTPQELAEFLHKINPDTGKRYNQADAAQYFKCSRQHITQTIKRYPTYFRFLDTARKKAMRQIPWEASTLQFETDIYRRIRDHAEYMATGGKGMPKWKLRRLWHFYNKIENENLVVEFDPSIPPNKYSQNGGFAFRYREPWDDDLIIRVNDYTNIDPDGKWLWVIPPRKPSFR